MRGVAAGLAAAAALAVPAAAAERPRTTEPGIVYPVTVNVTDMGITVSHARYVRGAIIRYHVRNRGTRPYRFVIVGQVIPVIRPRQEKTILINWNFRGRFLYKTMVRAGSSWRNTGVKGFITIF